MCQQGEVTLVEIDSQMEIQRSRLNRFDAWWQEDSLSHKFTENWYDNGVAGNVCPDRVPVWKGFLMGDVRTS